MFPPGLEPGTFRVLGERDNHYTTETCEIEQEITNMNTIFYMFFDKMYNLCAVRTNRLRRLLYVEAAASPVDGGGQDVFGQVFPLALQVVDLSLERIHLLPVDLAL